jgi:plasmid maintenance system killer protein
MIRRFADKETERLFQSKKSKAVPPGLWEKAESKLRVLDATTEVKEL